MENVGTTDNRNRRNNVAIILLSLLLLTSVGYNIYQSMDHNKEVETLNNTIVSSQDLRESLQHQKDSIMAMLEEYKGRNSALDQKIGEREKELLEKASQIDKLLRDNKISYSRYLKAKRDIDRMKFDADRSLAEIKRLSEENKRLAAENETLQVDVKTKKKRIDELTDENVLQKNKLTLAQRLLVAPEKIEIMGVRMRSGGKESETDRARKMEKMKICFAIPVNLAASAGKKTIYVQVVDPQGQTVAIQALGAGTTEVEGEEAQFSTSKEIEYNNETVNNQCVYFGNPTDVKFQEGRYTVRLFTEGYKMGEKSYNIR